MPDMSEPQSAPLSVGTPIHWWSHVHPQPYSASYFRPLGISALEGMTPWQDQLLALDRSWGYLLALHPPTGVCQLVNPHLALELRGTTALTANQEGLWLARDKRIYCIPPIEVDKAQDLEAYYRFTSPYGLEGLVLGDVGLFATCFQREKILLFDPESGALIQEFQAPGVGREQLTYQHGYLWVSDRVEETLYVLDPDSGRELGRILTPFPSPTGLSFWQDQLWVAYATDESYIHDNPNAPDPLSVAIRNKTFIAPLRLKPMGSTPGDEEDGDAPPAVAAACPILFYPQVRGPRATYTLSNGVRVEFTYLEELALEEDWSVPQLEWSIALPCTSPRQILHEVVPIGVPFRLEHQQGQQVAHFSLGEIHSGEARLFGWRAILDLYSIKYLVDPEDVEDLPLPQDLQDRYLMDDDNLAMDSPIVQDAAREAIGTETNLLRKMARIREFVYDHLSYRVTPRIESPDVVLRRGEGSCGEYVGLILALARLNGIACRTVGRYKCPPYPEYRQVPLFPEYNHVWIEFYLPGWGWVPMESNPDDLGDRPYPSRFFMGLPWTHIEIAKGIPFEACNAAPLTIGQLAVNHVQFRILEEL